MLRHPASEVLFHHRYPTSTENVQNACHPFSTRGELFKRNYVMVHNGWLVNQHELKREHYALGIRYISEQPDGRFNDSEALLYDLALYLEGKQSVLHAEGAIAFVLIERDENGQPVHLRWGRNEGSPLHIKNKPGRHLAITSEAARAPMVAANRLFTRDYETGTITSSALEIPEGYRYYFPATSKHTTSQKKVADWNGWERQANGMYEYVGLLNDDPNADLVAEYRPRSVSDKVDFELERASYLTEVALGNVADELLQCQDRAELLRKNMATYDAYDLVIEFLEASTEYEDLSDDIEVLQRVMTYLSSQLQYEATERATTKALGASTAVEGRQFNEIEVS